MKLPRKYVIAAGVLILLDIIFFTRVNPTNSPSLVLFLAFGVLACNLFVLVSAVLLASRLLISRPKGSLRRPALIVTGILVVLLALQSVGQLTVRDIIAVMALTILFWFYGSYYRRRQI